MPRSQVSMRRSLSLRLLVALTGLASLLTVTGCNGSSATQTPPAVPTLSLSTTSFSFGSVTTGGTSAAQTLTLTNSGSAVLALGTIALSDPTDYALTSNCGASLAPAASCALALTFTPKSVATLTGTLGISSNATPTTQSVSVSGTGTAIPYPALTLSVGALSFGNLAVGSTSAAQTITVANPGSAALTFTAIVLNDTTDYGLTSTCGSSLAPSTSCTLTVAFKPQSGASLPSSITLTDNAAASPQTVTLTGTGLVANAVLSASSLTFPATAPGTMSATQAVTLTDTGGAPLSISGIVLGGTNGSAFTQTNTCGTVLAAGASCAITVIFAPPAAGTPPPSGTYMAGIGITDNAASSPQAITLTGVSTTPALTHTLLTFPEADNSVTPLYTLVNNATKTIDMTMYELVDTAFSADLVAACARGVKVRVLLDASLEKSSNTAAYNQLNTAGTNCSAVFTNTAFQATHQKSILIDGVTSVIMTLNLTSRYYSTTRDFALVENDPADYAAIEATFNADLAAGTPYNGTQGASDFSYTPGLGDDLIWSPTTAQTAMLGIINNAKSTLLIENEELSSSTAGTIVAALAAACQRGVVVHFTIVDQSSYEPQFTTLKNAGCSVHTYPDTTTGFYVHAKVVVADFGFATQNVYMGSINYSSASMNQNRELGLFVTDTAAVQTLYTTLTADYNGGAAW